MAIGGDLVELIDEDCALGFQSGDDMVVVNDGVADVHGGAVAL